MIVWLLFVGHISISIRPFSISLPFWHRSLGLLLVIVGFVLYNIGEHITGYKKGWTDCIKAVENSINSKKTDV